MRHLGHLSGPQRSERPSVSTVAGATVPGATTLEAFGGLGNGVFDNTPIFNQIVTLGFRTILLGAGSVYRFSSVLPTIHYGLRLVGHGKSTTVLDFYQTSGNCLYYDGVVDAGGHLEGFTIRNRGGGTISAGIYLQAQAGGGSPDFAVIRDVNITGFTATDLFNYGLVLDGDARTGGALVGIRDIHVVNLSTFNTNTLCFDVRQGRDVCMEGVSAFATGTGGVNTGQISGANGTVPSGAVRLNANMGDLTLGFCAGVDVDGIYDDITVGAGASGYHIHAVATSVTVDPAAQTGRISTQEGVILANSSPTTRIPPFATSSGVAGSVTGTVAETTLKTIAVPGKRMGANGALKVTVTTSQTNNANVKTLRVKYGGTEFAALALASSATSHFAFTIFNKNATSAQGATGEVATSFGTSAVAAKTGAVDSTADQNVTVTGQLANVGDTLTVLNVVVEVIHQP